MSDFDLNIFSSARTGMLRNFPLLVESFNLTKEPHTVTGRDMSSGQMERVTVFLRDLKPKAFEEADKGPHQRTQRATLFDFGNDPFATSSDADFQNPQMKQEIMNTMNGRCTMKIGGVLMIQGAYLDKGTGMISASWVNRLAATPEEIRHGAVTILSPVLARLSMPAHDRQMHFAEVLYPDAGVTTESATDFNAMLGDLLSRTPNGAPARTFVAIRLTDTETGDTAANVVNRRRDKAAGYADEPVEASILNFWNSMPATYMDTLCERLDNGTLVARLVPGVRYQFVGSSLEELKKTTEKRGGLRWEFFEMTGGQTGWMQCSVVLRRHRSTERGTQEYFPASVWPLNNNLTPSPLTTVI